MEALARALATLSTRAEARTPQVVTAAFPFVPAVLGLAHFASTYLPADLLHRTVRFLGGRSALASGTDVHSIQVSSDGKTREGVEPLCARFDARYRAAFRDLGVLADIYFRTDDASHVALTHQALRRLEARGSLRPHAFSQLRCGGCDAVPPARMTRSEASAPRCPWCGSRELHDETAEQLGLDLESLRRHIDGGVEIAPGAARWVADILARPLDPWCVTRSNQVGMPLHRPLPGRSLYLWFESLVGYATLARRASGFGGAPRLRHVFGKNIVYHHAILWPALARAGLDMPHPIECLVRGFALGSCDWAKDDLSDPALRVFALLRVPDQGEDFRLTKSEFETFRAKIWANKYLNMLGRLDLRARPPDAALDVDPAWLAETVAALERIDGAAEAGHTQKIAREIDAYLRFTGRYCVETGLYWSDDAGDRQMAFLVRAVCASLIALVAPNADASVRAGARPSLSALAAMGSPEGHRASL